MPSFKCKDIGMDCGFEASSFTRGGLMRKIEQHAASAHSITTVSPDLKAKIESNIH